MSEQIVNKVAESGLITLDPVLFFPEYPVKSFDLAGYLFMGLILKEKDFREAMQKVDWNSYKGQSVAVFCSADAVIPSWAYMLVASNLSGVASYIFGGSPEELTKATILRNIEALDEKAYAGKKVVIKGCGDSPVGDFVFLALTAKLKPVVRSLMFGEPCSTVPVYKRKD
jgi:hypothetical protein